MKSNETPKTLKSEELELRKPYQKPEIIYQAPLEAMAAYCPEGDGGKLLGNCQSAYS